MDKYINFDSEEFRELEGQIEQALGNVQDVRDKHRPTLADNRYLSGEEVMEYLHISPRTLQEWRDTGKIPFIKIGGKVLYRQKDIESRLI